MKYKDVKPGMTFDTERHGRFIVKKKVVTISFDEDHPEKKMIRRSMQVDFPDKTCLITHKREDQEPTVKARSGFGGITEHGWDDSWEPL